MALLTSHDPPAHMPEYSRIQGQWQAWHGFIDECLQRHVGQMQSALPQPPDPTSQFYNAAHFDPGPVVDQEIVWNAFPKELLRRFGRERAMKLADGLWPLPAYQLGWRHDPEKPLPGAAALATLGATAPRDLLYRPQEEYCEWRAERADGRLKRVTFTCEAPEYWQAMFGGWLANSNVRFPGDRNQLLQLYRDLTGADVQMQDLLATRTMNTPMGWLAPGNYNPYNKWNTTDGIIHLIAQPNTLVAQIRLAVESTRRFCTSAGDPVERADVLMAGAELGGANRTSDVAIAGSINALARLGKRLTLANPIGLYIDHIDLAGWDVPDGIPPEACARVVRGSGRSILRLVVEVPSAMHDLQDVTIGGVPITSGGQIAECITMKVCARASLSSDVANGMLPMPGAGHVVPGERMVYAIDRRGVPAGSVRAYADVADATPPPPRARGLVPAAMRRRKAR